MSAGEALKAARAAGVRTGIGGEDLTLEAGARPPPAVLELLARHKAGVVALLRPGKGGWSGEDWGAHFDERASIMEFDGGLPRQEAEARAFECCVVDWMNRNFARSRPERCVVCGRDDEAHGALLPHGSEPTGHVWLHSWFWPTWLAGRKAGAIAALKAMGITPAGFLNDFGKNEGA